MPYGPKPKVRKSILPGVQANAPAVLLHQKVRGWQEETLLFQLILINLLPSIPTHQVINLVVWEMT